MGGAVLALCCMAVPLSSSAISATDTAEISVGIGIGKYIGLESVANVPGVGVGYQNDAYSKIMYAGESMSDFGTTTLRIVCNFDQNNDSSFYGGLNCKDNGWALSASSSNTYTENSTAYAAMVTSGQTNRILSKTTTPSESESTWTMKASPVSKTINNTNVSPSVVSSFLTPHVIPATSTVIATGKSWKQINSVDTYINEAKVDVQYGVSIGTTQPAGTYTGVINYTLSLNASV